MELESSGEKHDVGVEAPADIRIIEGIKYRRVDTGYTLKTYYAHSTDIGPGPGWDSRMNLLDDDYAMRRHGRTFSEGDVMDPSKLPDEPIYEWRPVEDENE